VNRFNTLSKKDKHISQQVFREEKSNMNHTLEKIMKELSDIRNWQRVRTEQTQPQSQPMFRPQIPVLSQAMQMPTVPQPGQPGSWSTQEKHMAWNSPNY
jgi:hypothetical protein